MSKANEIVQVESGVFIMGVVQAIDYEKELREEQENVRKKILQSMEDIKAGKGREYNEFFNELEKKYTHA